MPDLGLLIAGLAAAAAALILRLLPQRLAPRGVGVDQWFWKAYVEACRRGPTFPPELPQFLLDEKQWYPPLFGWLLARLPACVFDRYSQLFAVAVDLVRMVLAMATVNVVTGSAAAPVATAFAYALTPILVSYNTQLNPRALGALLLDSALLMALWMLHSAPPWVWLPLVILAALVLLTHKMTTQLLWFGCLAGPAATLKWQLALLIPASVFAALILSRGFYFRVLQAHRDIVVFWHRNWRWLGAHPVLESPLYCVPGYETPAKFYRSGLEGTQRRAQFLLGFNPWAWTVLLGVAWMYASGDPLGTATLWIAGWLGLTLLFVAATTFIPWMRWLGNGYLYLYNASFPAAILAGILWVDANGDLLVLALLALSFGGSAYGISRYLSELRASRTMKVDRDMEAMLERLREKPKGVAMCLPQHWHDVVAYKTGKDVLWGGHGYGFRRLEPVFPRLLRPIRELMEEYRVSYLLTYDGYLPESFLRELPPVSVEHFGVYRLFTLRERRP